MPGVGAKVISFSRRNYNFILAYSIPAVLLLVFVWDPEKPKDWNDSRAFRPQQGAFIMLLMASYWVTECVPLSLTSFLPVVLVPLMGIEGSDAVAAKYFNSTGFYLLSCLIMALAIERCQSIVIRITSCVVSSAGAKIPGILLRLMMVTMFLSMFCINSSCTSMMVPIVKLIMKELRKKTVPDDPNDPSYPEALNTFNNIKTVFFLATTYAANIGGTGTPIGSATNVVCLDLLSNFQHDVIEGDIQVRNPKKCFYSATFTFTSWTIYTIVPMLINIIVAWLCLQIHLLRVPSWMKFYSRKTAPEIVQLEIEEVVIAEVRKEIQRQHKELGPITFYEILVCSVYVVFILMSIFREPKIFPGWADSVYGSGYIADATLSLIICFMLYILPNKPEHYKNFLEGGFGSGVKDKLMNWDFSEKHIGWPTIILLGGGSAMALAVQTSGLNIAIAEFLGSNQLFEKFNKESLLLVALILTAVLTSVTSNAATAIILAPVLLTLAQKKSIHPLYLVIAPSVGASYAFIFRVSNASSVIAFHEGDLKSKDTIKVGFSTTVICNIVLYIFVNAIASPIGRYGDYKHHCDFVEPITTQRSIARMIQDHDSSDIMELRNFSE